MNDILVDCRTAGNLNGHNMCMYGVFVDNLGTLGRETLTYQWREIMDS